ncbi:MAG: L,D-transpeptidase family protein, partial [Alphaproteobacteria bacterium]|nr:L,D-transpeptidase family protein [Alphaproteobacteria bacterium]
MTSNLAAEASLTNEAAILSKIDTLPISHEDKADLSRIYQSVNNTLIWPSRNPLLAEIIERFSHADFDGLDPEVYKISQSLITQPIQTDQDILITLALLTYAKDLNGGRQLIKPTKLIDVHPLQRDVVAIIVAGLINGNTQWLEFLPPPHPQYTRLKGALCHFHALEQKGPWPQIDSEHTLKPGDTHTDVLILRHQLAMHDLLAFEESTYFDEKLSQAVIAYQNLHQLEPDGVVGTLTRVSLNMSPYQWKRLISLNMERWRHFPEFENAHHILVNIPGNFLKVIRSGSVVLTLPVVVGRPQRKTPEFIAPMQQVVLNPSWSVPPGISRDILRKAKENPSYLVSKGIRVIDKTTHAHVDPLSVNWAQY